MLSLCISLTRECALICDASARLLSMGGDNATALCSMASLICDRCATECELNSALDHCRHCAIACRRCEEACDSMVAEYA